RLRRRRARRPGRACARRAEPAAEHRQEEAKDLAPLAAKALGLHRGGLLPQSAALAPRLVLGGLVAAPILGGLLARVVAIPPGEAGAHLREPHVFARHEDVADDALVAVGLVPFHG